MINRDEIAKIYNTIPESHRPLADILQKAIRYVITKPSLSLKKSNIALTIIVRDLYQKRTNSNVDSIMVHTILNNKQFIKTIQPRRIYLLMNLVNKMTFNESNDVVNSKAAKIVIDYLTDIYEWYIN